VTKNDKATKRDQRIHTGIAGEHFVAGELSRRGWVATLTAKNTPGYDVVADRPDGSAHVRIDVKTRTSAYRRAWRLGSDIRMSGERDFIVLVDIGDEGDAPAYWIVPARTALKLLTNGQIRTKDVEEFRDRWNLLDS
jgi:hypothetical protein